MNLTREQKEEILLKIITKWNQFLSLVRFKEETPLSQKMSLFFEPCVEFLSQEAGLRKDVEEHGMLAKALITMAVEASGQYDRGQAFAAAQQLGWKPAFPPRRQSIFSSLMRQLNTPLKRSAGLILLAGIALSLIGIFQLDSYDGFDVWMKAVFRQRKYYAHEYWMSAWGAYLTIIGFLFSFAYDSTIAKVAKWIAKG